MAAAMDKVTLISIFEADGWTRDRDAIGSIRVWKQRETAAPTVTVEEGMIHTNPIDADRLGVSVGKRYNDRTVFLNTRQVELLRDHLTNFLETADER